LCGRARSARLSASIASCCIHDPLLMIRRCERGGTPPSSSRFSEPA
jgi:hypothetical protein